jgi:hypothetical protein
MKKISLALVALGFLSISIQSCTSDPCKDKSATTLCSGKGTLVSNTNSCDCSCDAGYTGTACDKTYGQLFVGTFSCVETGSKSGSSSYTAQISASTNLSEVNAKNVWDQFKNNVKISVSGSNITINLQEPDNDKFFVQNGTGTWSLNSSGKVVIKLTYDVVDNSGATSVTDRITSATWTQL